MKANKEMKVVGGAWLVGLAVLLTVPERAIWPTLAGLVVAFVVLLAILKRRRG